MFDTRSVLIIIQLSLLDVFVSIIVNKSLFVNSKRIKRIKMLIYIRKVYIQTGRSGVIYNCINLSRKEIK